MVDCYQWNTWVTDTMTLFIALVTLVLHLHLTEANYSVKYLGCYKDSGHRSVLNESNSRSRTDANVDWCINRCARAGHRYAGLRYQSYCRCGNSGYDKYGKGGGCDRICPGNPVQICGGARRNSVYEIIKVDTNPHRPSTTSRSLIPSQTTGELRQVYLGCFASGDLSDAEITLDNLTIAMCLDHCSQAGYRFAGLYYGNKCRCGNPGNYLNRRQARYCKVSCSGNQSQNCGGYTSDSIYAILNYTESYLGCYYDGMPKALDQVYTNAVDTAGICMLHCDYQGYRYAGLQYGKLCRCGNDGYNRYGEATGCNSTCAGDSSQLCGGFYQNSVYEIVRPAATTTSTSLPTMKVSAQTTTFTVKGNGAEDMSSEIGQYAGIGVSVLVICIGVVIGLILCILRRKRRSNGNREKGPENMAMRSVEPEASSNTSHVPQVQDEVRDTDLYMNCAHDPIQSSTRGDDLPNTTVVADHLVYSLAEPVEEDLVVVDNELYGT